MQKDIGRLQGCMSKVNAALEKDHDRMNRIDHNMRGLEKEMDAKFLIVSRRIAEVEKKQYILIGGIGTIQFIVMLVFKYVL